MSVLIFIGVFFATALADVFWTLYFINVQEKKAFIASFWSSMIVVCSAFTIMTYQESWVYSIAAVLGAFTGTYGTMKWKERKDKKDGNKVSDTVG